MARFKIDLVKLQELHERGLTGVAMAKALGVRPPCISKNLRKLDLARAQDLVLEAAQKINRKYLRVMDRANRNAQIVDGELNYLNKKIVQARGEERDKLSKSRLDHIAEDRKLSDSLVSAARASVQIDRVMIVQRTIEEIFEKLSPEMKKEFLDELRRRRSLQSVIGPVDCDTI
jgi:predicted transcriptional regulator